jgi:osmoprotectant transport system ATP-binding protein
MIVLDNVEKRYDDGFQALKNVNLTFKEGEITVLIGPSGCGKTTTMKLVNRLITPTKGRITIRGEDIARMDPVQLRRKIGYVIQNIGLFPHMTIAQNVGIVPRLQKWAKSEIDRKVDALLRLVRLDPDIYRNRYPAELSGGQQQRIGVIRALAADQDIILMDEPFSALDPISREQLQDELIRLQEELRKTIVFVTHDMDEAIKIADTIVLMKDGEVVQSGKPDAILRHPANEFVRDFIGKKRLAAAVPNRSPMEALPVVDEVIVEHPATVYPTRGLAEAIKIMEKRRVDSLLIVNRERKLLGSVSIYRLLEHYGDESKTVADVMRPVEHSVESGTSLAVALNMMSAHNLSNLAVVRSGSEFVGLITRGSVVRLMAEAYAGFEPARAEAL